DSGWQGWPEAGKERYVLSWVAQLTGQLLDFAEERHAGSNLRRRVVTRPHQPLQRSTANRKLDISFVASEQFSVNQDGLQFVSAVIDFLWMNNEQLGFDPTILTVGDKRYIEIERDNCIERLVIDKLIKRVACVAGQATTCWRVHRDDEYNTQLVVKDSWQYPEREEEGELLRWAADKNVVNVARYFHHETVRFNDRDNDIRRVRKGLDITKVENYAPRKPMSPLSTTERRVSRRDGSRSLAGQKRSSSCTNPSSKRTCLSSPTKPATANRIHRRVIVRDYGKPIFSASSQRRLLVAFEQCINGYESLYTQAGMLQRDTRGSCGNFWSAWKLARALSWQLECLSTTNSTPSCTTSNYSFGCSFGPAFITMDSKRGLFSGLTNGTISTLKN
ncbi:uncharacterized protein M421DRAFT_399019, partial [Didymella exigua CBS 183.55]